MVDDEFDDIGHMRLNLIIQRRGEDLIRMLRQLCHKICSNKFRYVIAPLIVAVATLGLVFENIVHFSYNQLQYFFKTLSPDNQTLFTTLSICLYIMTFISFYQSICISNAPPGSLIKPRLKRLLRNNHGFYTEVNECHKQSNRYKPPRTSHCSTCKCVVRMDHHCPYINNCVGLKNLKAFILFTGYGGLFALLFLVFSIKYYFNLKSERVEPLTEGEITMWLFLSFVAFFLTLSMCGLALSNVYLAAKNITQLQMLKGTLRLNDKHGTHPNPYDLGLFTNLNTLFQSQKWSFWLPTQLVTQNDGTQFIKIPEVTYDDIKKLPSHIKDDIRTVTERSIPQTIEELRQKQRNNYQNTVFFYLGKEYRLFPIEKQPIENDPQQQSMQNQGFTPQGFMHTQQPSAKYQSAERQRIQDELRQIADTGENIEQAQQDEQAVEYKEIVEQIYGEQANELEENAHNQQGVQPTTDKGLLLTLDEGGNVATHIDQYYKDQN